MIALGGDAKEVAWESDRWPSLTGDEYDAKKFSKKKRGESFGMARKEGNEEVELLVKFKSVAYFHSRWVQESFVEKQRLTQLFIKHPKN